MGDDNDDGVDVAAEDHFVVEGADDEDGDDEGVDLVAVDPEGAEQDEVGVEGGREDDAEDDEGYDSFIEERSRPEPPQPNPTVVRDANGWNLIAKLGPTASFLSSFPALLEVPDQHQQAWVDAFSKVLRRWRVAVTEVEIIIALSWLLFLPQSLLRRPTRGGRAGRKEVAKRFNHLAQGDWGSVFEQWEKDKNIQTAEKERRRRREPRANNEVTRRRGEERWLGSSQLGRSPRQ